MIVYLLLFLLLSFYQNTNVRAANSALCFLTNRPASETVQFAEELSRDAMEYGIEIFIMIDDNNFNVSRINTSFNLRLMQISNEKCVHYGYQNTISLYWKWRQVTSWDKALLYFALLNRNYSFVWLIESDVFIPSVKAFRSIHELYSNSSDLVVPRNQINLLGNTSTWLWIKALGKVLPPWSRSMVNVVGLSWRMLVAINDYVQWLGEVPYHEFLFNTLAMQLNFTIVAPTELTTVTYFHSSSLGEIFKKPNNLWHPSKSLQKQKLWREKLVVDSEEVLSYYGQNNSTRR